MRAEQAVDAEELLSYGSPRKQFHTPNGSGGMNGGTGSGNSRGSAAATSRDAAELLDFYRQRCQHFQAERQVLLDHMAQVEVSKEELHRAKWDVKMRKQEIADLEDSLKKANATIFQLQEEKLELESENAALLMQEQDDRKKIQHLLALTQPVMEEVTFFRDRRPSTSTTFPMSVSGKTKTYPYPSTMHVGSEEMADENKSVASNTTYKPRSRLSQSAKSVAASRVLRTVYMPNDQAATLTSAVEDLRAQLKKQKELFEARLEQLLDGFADEKAKGQQELRRLEETNEMLESKLVKSQRVLEKTTKDYLVLRHQSQEAERVAHEELHSVREKCAKLDQEKVAATREALAEADATKEQAEEETAQCAQELRDQAVSRERDLHILREQYAALQDACTRRIQDLQTRLTKLRTRYRSLDQRRAMEMEGFTRDITELKRHIQRLESVLYGRRISIRQHEVLHPRGTRISVLDSSDVHEEIAALQQRVADLAADVEAS